jgi:hypothetical protein
VILEFGNIQALYFAGPQQLYLEAGAHGRMLCDIITRRVTIAYPESEEADPWLLSHLFFTVPLAELLKRLELYMALMAGVAIDGKGLLIAGESGAGKTTPALALARAGFAFLADDTVFLSTANPRLARSPASTLAPTPKDQALMELVCNVLRTDPRSAQAHLDALAAVVKQCRCYRLQTGRDFDKLAVVLRGMVESTRTQAHDARMRVTPAPAFRGKS